MNDRTDSPLPQRKRPVHVPPIERHNVPIIVFLTLTIQPRGDFLANDTFRTAFDGACADADAWRVGRFMIMPDHLHLFCVPAKEPRVAIKRWSGYLKERITKRLNARLEGEPAASRDAGSGLVSASGSAQPRPPSRHPPRFHHLEGEPVASRDAGSGSAQPRPPSARSWRWQSDCWDTQMRNGAHYHERWEYVRQNPVRKGLVNRPEDWPWQGTLNELRW
jgi:REP element-mobilizing transposase RayT